MFYLKLALNNLKQSFQQFAPFFLVSVTTFVFCTITLLILTSPTADAMGTGSFALGLASIVLVVLSAILCLYSYNFLLRQRSQEFGLYNILGMNKKQIIWLSTLELGVIYLVTVLLGSLLSAIFSNLFYLIFVHLIAFDDLNFQLTLPAFLISIFLFGAIFFCLEVVSLVKISRTSALHLFGNQRQGEREPRGNILLALIALLATGYGYYLSVTAGDTSALVGIQNFFQAILAVILGTYLFYISFISWYLKIRRRNKQYFYQPQHFITVSQMIFRMKQNAVGLANITLLALLTIRLYLRFRQKIRLLEDFLTVADLEDLQLPSDIHYQGLIRAITDQEASRFLQAKTQREDLQNLVKMWSHQMKVPLSVLSLMAQTDQLDKKEIGQQVLRLEKYLDTLLTYLKFSQNKDDFRFEVCSTRAIVTDLVKKYRLSFLAKELSVHIEGDWQVKSDKKWLNFAISQILDNAIKYSQKGGQITIDLSQEELVLADTGMGILPEDLPRLFEEGFTGYNGHEHKKATGLGLYMTKQVLDQLGLSIQIDSQIDQGTAVRIYRQGKT